MADVVSIRPDAEALPQNVEAERAVLGAMLVTSSALRAVRAETGLTPRHFYFEKHSEIYTALQQISEREGHCDELMLGNALPRHRDYLSELVAKVPAAGNAVHYGRIVIERAQQRAKLEGAQKITQGVRVGGKDGEALIRDGLHLAAADFTVEAEPTSGEEVMDEFFDFLDSEEDPEVFELPWKKLNQSVLGGYRRKQMSVLAGWPKMGKSYVLDQMLAAFSDQGKRCAVFALEVSRHERAARNLTMRTGIATEKLLRKKLTAEEHRRLSKAREKGLPFDYFECPGWSADRIAERIVYGGYDIVAVDPVTKIPRFEKTEVASEVSGRLTEVAVRANCHVILVSHLSKTRGTSPNGVRPRPVVADLRGSGMIEGDAHAILFLHRQQDEKTSVPLPLGEIYFDRSRLGPPIGVEVAQFARTLTFHEMGEEPTHKQEAMPIDGNGHDKEVWS